MQINDGYKLQWQRRWRILTLKVCLNTVYFAEIEKLLLKVL